MSPIPRGILVTGAQAWHAALDDGLQPETLTEAEWLRRLGDAPRRATFARKLAAAGRARRAQEVRAEVAREIRETDRKVEREAKKTAKRKALASPVEALAASRSASAVVDDDPKHDPYDPKCDCFACEAARKEDDVKPKKDDEPREHVFQVGGLAMRVEIPVFEETQRAPQTPREEARARIARRLGIPHNEAERMPDGTLLAIHSDALASMKGRTK